jgi:hypothetical protein
LSTKYISPSSKYRIHPIYVPIDSGVYMHEMDIDPISGCRVRG